MKTPAEITAELAALAKLSRQPMAAGDIPLEAIMWAVTVLLWASDDPKAPRPVSELISDQLLRQEP